MSNSSKKPDESDKSTMTWGEYKALANKILGPARELTPEDYSWSGIRIPEKKDGKKKMIVTYHKSKGH